MYHMLIRGMWVGCNARVKYWHNLLNSVQIIFFFPWQNQYNAIFLSAECKLFHIPSLPAALGTSHACVNHGNYENQSRNYLIVGL